MTAQIEVPDELQDIHEAISWVLGFWRRLISVAGKSPNFLAELDDLLLDLKDGLRAESPNADSQHEDGLEGVPAGRFLQSGEAVAKLAAYDRLLREVHTPDLTESREIGDVVAAEVGHDSSPSLDAHSGAADTVSVGEPGSGDGESPGPGTTTGGDQ